MQKLFIIDASGYLYSAYFAIRNMTNKEGESTNALYGFGRSLLKLIKDFQPTHVLAVFDGPNNAKKRLEMFSDYKAHRSATPPDLPYQIKWARELCELLGVAVLNIPDVEADDTMGSTAIWAAAQGTEVFLCTSDKDMGQVVSDKIFLLNTRKENLIAGPAQVVEQYGVAPTQIVDLMALIGDTSDNVPGVPGIGPKTAATLIQQFGTLENLLANTSQIVGDKKRLLISENTDKALLSKKLVALDLSVDIPQEPDFYRLKGHSNTTALKDFYLKMGFSSLLKELDNQSATSAPSVEPPKTSTTKYVVVDDVDALHTLIQELQTQSEIALYVQPLHTNPMQKGLAGISFSIEPHTAWYIPLHGVLGENKALEMLKPLFENPRVGFYGHNIKQHYHALANYHIHLANISFDTLLASYLLNAHHRQHSVEALSLQHFGQAKTSLADIQGKGKTATSLLELLPEVVCVYNCEHADFACRLKLILQKEMQERGMQKLMYEIELPLLRVLAGMERHGIFLDAEHLAGMAKIIQTKISRLEQEIFAIAGEEFNLNSPKQLSHILQDKLGIKLPKKTATGFSTNAEILEDLKEQYPIAHLLLEYRTVEKLRSTYVESLPNDINAQTGRIHCTFNQTVAATGRLSCQDPNLQNIPIRSEEGHKIRESFRPQLPGWSYISADYSQIELRLLAHYSEEPHLIHAFLNNQDIHVFTAAAVLGITPEEVTKEQRSQAKAVNFGIIYGQQAFGLAKELGIDVKTAAIFIEKYFQGYPKVKEFLESSKEKTRKTGKAVTFTGRERAIPEIHSKNIHLRMLAERLAVNTPLQGSQADLIKMAMLEIDRKIKEMQLRGYMILQIHDELVFEVPDEEVAIFSTMVKEAMKKVVELKIPLVVDIAIGKNWKEC